MKRIFTAIFLICSLLAFTGCGGGGMKSKPGHLNLALWWFGETLDPAHAWDGWTLTRIGAGETLVAVDEHMSSCRSSPTSGSTSTLRHGASTSART